jgi:hypothetical protein
VYSFLQRVIFAGPEGTGSVPSHFSPSYEGRDQSDGMEAVPRMKNEHRRRCPRL